MTNQATRIRLRDLSDELGIDLDLATSLLQAACTGHGGRPPRKPFGPSTVIGMSLAGRIRALAARPSTAGRPAKTGRLVVSTTAAVPEPAPETLAADPSLTATLFLAPGMKPAPVSRMPAPPVPAAAAPPTSTVEPEPTLEVPTDEPDWQRRGIDADQRDRWLLAGLKPTESVLAEQCLLAGIDPDQLARRVSGQTALSRLRGGEPATSVWARLQEGEDRGRGPGRLQGRFA